MTVWQSIEAIRGFTGPDVESAVVEPAAREVLVAFDDFALHYERVHQTG